MTLKTTAIIGGFASDEESKLNDYLSQITAGVYGKTKEVTAIRSIDYSEITKTFTLSMRNASFSDQVGCQIILTETDDLYEKALKGTVAFIEGQELESGENRIENTPEEVIEVKKDASGEYYVVKQK